VGDLEYEGFTIGVDQEVPITLGWQLYHRPGSAKRHAGDRHRTIAVDLGSGYVANHSPVSLLRPRAAQARG
jgi:hypothetical protein